MNLKPMPLLLHYLMGCLCLQDGQESGWHAAPLGGCHHITVCLLGIPGLAQCQVCEAAHGGPCSLLSTTSLNPVAAFRNVDGKPADS